MRCRAKSHLLEEIGKGIEKPIGMETLIGWKVEKDLYKDHYKKDTDNVMIIQDNTFYQKQSQKS